MLTALKTEEHNIIAGEGFCNFDGNFIVELVNDSRSTYRQEDYDQAGLVITARGVLFKPLFWTFQPRKVNSA